MAADRLTRITIERERILILARQGSTRAWCKECGREVEFVRQDQATRVLDASFGQPGKWRQRKIHLGQAKDGLEICVKSLLRFLQAASSGDELTSKENS